jgi:hypothetical protein
MQAVNERLLKNSRKSPFKRKLKSTAHGSVHMWRWLKDRVVIRYWEKLLSLTEENAVDCTAWVESL